MPLDALVDAKLERIGGLAYTQMTVLLQEQLELGRSVVIECGVGDELREEWRNITNSTGATVLIIDTICCNVEVHRQRFGAT